MAYPASYYEEAQRIIDKRRVDNGKISDARFAEIRSKLPEAVTITEDLALTIDKLAKIILSSADNKPQLIEELKNENLAMQEELERLLTHSGYPSDYLDPIYICKECNDTGVLDDGRCSCYKQVLRQLASKELSRSLPIGLNTFESFDLSFYSDKPSPDLKGLSPEKIMQKNYEYCKAYAEDFHIPCESVFMTGATGLGKTHLSLAVAKKVTEKGYSCVYGSAPDVLRRIENAHFNRKAEDAEVMSTVKECDLLVLDDLGAEFDSSFYHSCLYDMINTRLNFGRPIIISTNLTVSEIRERYSDRIASRLLSMKNLVFFGQDIRVLKKSKN